MNLFNNREIAIALWGAVLIAWVLFATRRSSAFGNLLKVFAQRQILAALGLMSLYISLMIFGLYKIGLWDAGQIKNTILWSLSVAAVLLLRINSIADDPHYYRNAIRDNLKIIVVLEFVIAFYTFDLWQELLIVPVAAILTAMLAVAEIRKEHAKVARLLSNMMALFGFFLIAHATYRLAVDFQSFATMQTLTDFYLPLLLSLLFLPFLFVLALYVSYKNAFVSLRFSLKNHELETYAKRRAFLGLHVRTGLLKRWMRNLSIAKPKDRGEIDKSIHAVKRFYARERNPPDVPFKSGWSPYRAAGFLATEGLQSGDYHEGGGEGGNWWASSPYLDVGEAAIIPSNVAYYVEGSEYAATTLKLVLNVNESQSAQGARRRFIGMARTLFKNGLGHDMPGDIDDLIASETATTRGLYGKKIAFSKEPWPGHRFDGYTLEFIIGNESAQGESAGTQDRPRAMHE